MSTADTHSEPDGSHSGNTKKEIMRKYSSTQKFNSTFAYIKTTADFTDYMDSAAYYSD
jgi:hypothetical protein